MTPELSRRIGAAMNTETMRTAVTAHGPAHLTAVFAAANVFTDLPLEYQRLILEAEDELKEAE